MFAASNTIFQGMKCCSSLHEPHIRGGIEHPQTSPWRDQYCRAPIGVERWQCCVQTGDKQLLFYLNKNTRTVFAMVDYEALWKHKHIGLMESTRRSLAAAGIPSGEVEEPTIPPHSRSQINNASKANTFGDRWLCPLGAPAVVAHLSEIFRAGVSEMEL